MEKGKSFKFTIIDYKNITFKFLKDSIINKLYKMENFEDIIRKYMNE